MYTNRALGIFWPNCSNALDKYVSPTGSPNLEAQPNPPNNDQPPLQRH